MLSGLTTTKKTVALRLKEQIECELAVGKYQLDIVDTPVEVFWEKYLDWARKHKRPSTIATEKIFWKQLLEFAKPKTFADVTRRDIEALQWMFCD